ncbi:hypothetical protein BH09ACT9_BH09ACT9_00490 [soil metagenome]
MNKYVILGSRVGVIGPFDSKSEVEPYLRLNQPTDETWEVRELIWPYFASTPSSQLPEGQNK